jgi:hypothetical protein
VRGRIGAGGSVMAGVLSEQGLSGVVLDAGGYFDDRDFTQQEIPAYQNLYWRGLGIEPERDAALRRFGLGALPEDQTLAPDTRGRR